MSFAYVGGYTPNGGGIQCFALDRQTGGLTPLALTSGIADPTRLLILGDRLYAANRLHDSIATFAIEGDLRLIGYSATEGSYPRTLVIQGDFLYAMNQRSDAITVFRLEAGRPRFTGQYIPTGSPAHLAFFDARGVSAG